MAICIARLLSSNLKGVVEQKFSRSPVQSALFTAPPPQYQLRSDGPGHRTLIKKTELWGCMEQLSTPILATRFI